jgi:Cof subfamily protein (haloacid dehalogenase superfamily)
VTHTRIVFLDVDGTLIDHSQRLAPSVATAVRTARDAGHLVYLSTGRSRAEIPDYISDIGFDGVISAGGGFIERGGQLIAAHTMPEPVVRDLVEFFERHDIEYTLQGYEATYPSEGLLARMRPLLDEWAFSARSTDRVIEMMTYRGQQPTSGVAKATFFGSDPRTFATVRDGLGDRFHVITGTIPYLGEAGGEVSLCGIHKGAAVRRVVDALGMDITHSIAIGDSTNDLEMLEIAGVGIAMGNADAALKAVADEITASVDDDGVAKAFTLHVLA